MLPHASLCVHPSIVLARAHACERDDGLEPLGDAIAELSVRIQAATCELLVLIRQFDERAGWNTGFTSCAHWLSWRVGLDLGAVVQRALDAATDRLRREAAASPPSDDRLPETTAGQRRADALGVLAESALAHDLDPGTAGDRYQVVLHVEAETRADDDAVSIVPSDTGQAVLEDGICLWKIYGSKRSIPSRSSLVWP